MEPLPRHLGHLSQGKPAAAADSVSSGVGKTHPSPYAWVPKELIDEARTIQKMYRNAVKAVVEHRNRDGTYRYSPYDSTSLPIARFIATYKPEKSLALICTVAEAQGMRPTMEDVHFFKRQTMVLLQGSLMVIVVGTLLIMHAMR